MGGLLLLLRIYQLQGI